MNPEAANGSEAGRRREDPAREEEWARALRRLGVAGGFLRRRGLLILATALTFAGVAALALTWLYPASYESNVVLAVDDREAVALGGVRPLPETGYRMLALSPEVMDRLREQPAAGSDLEPGRLTVRLLDPRAVRQEGMARLLQLSATASDPQKAADLADAWAAALIEAESRRAREAGAWTLEKALEERRLRQERRVREQEVRQGVAQQASSTAAAAEGLQLEMEKALLELAIAELETVRGGRTQGAGDAPAEGSPEDLAATLAARTMPDPRLDEMLDRLQTARGRLSVFLPARPKPQARARGILVRAILAGLAGALLGLLVAASRELSGR